MSLRRGGYLKETGMTNDDPMYLRHLEQALEAAELEIKGLEGELRE